jgi:hypothetical protein
VESFLKLGIGGIGLALLPKESAKISVSVGVTRPKWREQFGMMFRAPRRKHREIAFGETFASALIDAIQRIDETIAERTE